MENLLFLGVPILKHIRVYQTLFKEGRGLVSYVTTKDSFPSYLISSPSSQQFTDHGKSIWQTANVHIRVNKDTGLSGFLQFTDATINVILWHISSCI